MNGAKHMTRLIADIALSARLRTATEVLEICDEKGNILGYYQPTATLKSPYSQEELERRRIEKGGFTLEEILYQLPT
jgi:hypothetical protein